MVTQEALKVVDRIMVQPKRVAGRARSTVNSSYGLLVWIYGRSSLGFRKMGDRAVTRTATPASGPPGLPGGRGDSSRTLPWQTG